MGAFASALQGFGGIGADVAAGRQQFQDQRTLDAFNKLKLRQDALNLATIQSKLKQAGQPEFIGTATDPTTQATLAILRDPTTGQIRTQALVPGMDPARTQAQAEQMVSTLPPNLQSVARQSYQLAAATGGPVAGMAALQKIVDQYTGELTKPNPETMGTQAGRYTSADGKTGWGFRNAKDGKIYDGATGQPVTATDFVPTSGLPTPSVSFQTVAGPGGTNQLEAIPESRSKTGGITFGKPIPVGQKALPAGTAEKLQSMVSTVQPVIEALQRMRDNADVLANPSSVLKIGAATMQGTGSGIANFAARFANMSEQERQYAQDYITTKEGINAVRQALQATGFRGPEAWGALLEQRGTLLNRPDVTRGVIDQSIKILQGQVGQAYNMLGERQPNVGTAPSQLNIGDIIDGYRYMGGDPNSDSAWKKVTNARR